MQRRNGVGDRVELITIRLFKHVLLAAEDAAPQRPIPLDQRRVGTQKMKSETI